MLEKSGNESNGAGQSGADPSGAHLIGKHVLVGLIYLDANGDTEKMHQFHGLVNAVREDGIHMILQGERFGETFTLPLDPPAFEPAAPATYTLIENGEEVENPDYIARWTIQAPSPNE